MFHNKWFLMDDEKIPMTLRGYTLMSDELHHLKQVDRPDVIKAIAAAREHGDLSENAEYHAARERQTFIEGRIAELEDRLSRAEVIDVHAVQGDRIKFGATVTLLDDDSDINIRYQIVGSDEADIKSGLLSIASPLARALIGKTVEDQIEVPTPSGGKSYTVEKIEYC